MGAVDLAPTDQTCLPAVPKAIAATVKLLAPLKGKAAGEDCCAGCSELQGSPVPATGFFIKHAD